MPRERPAGGRTTGIRRSLRTGTGMRISEELGTRWGFAHYQMARAMERFRAGNWDDAVVEIEADTGPAGETGQGHSLILGGSVLALIRLHRNDLPGARDAAAPGELSAVGADYRTDWSAWVQALLLEADV